MTNPTLQAELAQVLHTLWLVFYENSTLTSMADTYYIAELEALKATLATVSKHLPEKKVFIDIPEVDFTGKVIKVYKGETYTPYMIAYNTAITEMEKTLGGNDG